MRPGLVVVLLPDPDLCPRVSQISEPVFVQTLVTEAPIEAFYIAVLHRSAGLNGMPAKSLFIGPLIGPRCPPPPSPAQQVSSSRLKRPRFAASECDRCPFHRLEPQLQSGLLLRYGVRERPPPIRRGRSHPVQRARSAGPVGAHRGASQFMQPRPSRFVTLQPQHPLQTHGARTALQAGDPQDRLEPKC